MVYADDFPTPIWEALNTALLGIYDSICAFTDRITFPVDLTEHEISEILTDEEAKAYIRVKNWLEDNYPSNGSGFYTIMRRSVSL